MLKSGSGSFRKRSSTRSPLTCFTFSASHGIKNCKFVMLSNVKTVSPIPVKLPERFRLAIIKNLEGRWIFAKAKYDVTCQLRQLARIFVVPSQITFECPCGPSQVGSFLALDTFYFSSLVVSDVLTFKTNPAFHGRHSNLKATT